MERLIEKLVLKNAIKFKGKANPGAIMGALFSENPLLKQDANMASKMVQEMVKKINSLSLEEQTKRLQKIAPNLLEEKKEKKKKDLPELKNVQGKFVTRMPPEPSKYIHFGHAMSFLINYMYAKKYNGKCILRLDDTNPEKSKEEYYQSIYDDLLWLRVSPDDTWIASKHMEEFYKYAEILIEKEKAYVCFCEQEMMRDYRHRSMICEHKNKPVRKNLEEWENMLAWKYKPGECVLRLSADMDSPNAVMRDPILFRLSNAKHTLQKDKYKVWPMYDFESVVAEELTGVTHIFRSNEFGNMRIELQNYIKGHLNFREQEVLQYGRFTIGEAITQGRDIRELIESGKVDGWDDPRLITIKALKRRGFIPETFYEVVLESGLSPNPTRLDWSVIYSINRKLIDNHTKRFFFVINPKKIIVKNELGLVEVPNHPTNKEFGIRKIKLGENYYVQDEIEKGKNYRFMHLFNFKDGEFSSIEYDPDLKAKIIHAVPVEDAIDVQVLMDDGSIVKGKGEKALSNLKEGEVVQFERAFFCRLDDKEKMLFVYTHD